MNAWLSVTADSGLLVLFGGDKATLCCPANGPLAHRLTCPKTALFEQMIGAMVRCGFPERGTPVRNGFSETLVQRQSGIHPMVEQRSVGKLVSSPKPPEAGARKGQAFHPA